MVEKQGGKVEVFGGKYVCMGGRDMVVRLEPGGLGVLARVVGERGGTVVSTDKDVSFLGGRGDVDERLG